MDELTIFYQDADGDIFSLEVETLHDLQKWLTQHLSDIYYLKTK